MGQGGVPERRVALAVAPRSPCESARPERNAEDGVTPLTAGTQLARVKPGLPAGLSVATAGMRLMAATPTGREQA